MNSRLLEEALQSWVDLTRELHAQARHSSDWAVAAMKRCVVLEAVISDLDRKLASARQVWGSDIPRTSIEILARVKSLRGEDPLQAEREELIAHLPFDLARPFLEEGTTEEEWAEAGSSITTDTDYLLGRISDLLGWALEKADNERGISVQIARSKLSAWLWLLGDEAYNALPWDDAGPYQRDLFKSIERWIAEKEGER